MTQWAGRPWSCPVEMQAHFFLPPVHFLALPPRWGDQSLASFVTRVSDMTMTAVHRPGARGGHSATAN